MEISGINNMLFAYGYRRGASKKPVDSGFLNAVIDASEKTEEIGEENVSQTGSVSLESMLRAKHKNLAYHVFDGSTSNWVNRNDYPHYLLYEDSDEATEKVANWEPEGENPVYSPFEAPPEINALGSVAPGSKAVVIHPKVQEKMDADPEYAKEIFNRIEAWFEFDLARNEAIMPGSSFGMCQAVAIGEDGSIVNAQASNPLSNRITYSGCSFKEMMERLRKKRARSEYFMNLRIEAELKRKAAISKLENMMSSDDFRKALGDTVGGLPIDELFAITRSEFSQMF